MERMTRIVCGVLLWMAGSAFAVSWVGRYESYPYVTDERDPVPGLFFSKVCEPGVSGEQNASYVTIGCVYPARQGVSPAFSGHLEIPAMLDGLPVRKIQDRAFIACTALRSVTIPETVREIGPFAFGFCISLEKVTFKGGLESVGECAFSNCVSLTSVTFPSTLKRLGPCPFVLCDSLKTITFLGNAPELDGPRNRESHTESYLGEKRLAGAPVPARAAIHVKRGTYGWRVPSSNAMPEKWPTQYGWMQAHPLVVDAADGSSVPGEAFPSTNYIYQTVTNVVNTRETIHTFSTVTNLQYVTVTNDIRSTLSVTNVVRTFSEVTNTLYVAGLSTNAPLPGFPIAQPAATYSMKAGGGRETMIPGAVGWDALGLPPGMTWNRETGTLSGTPWQSGTYDVFLVCGSGASTLVMRTTVSVAGFDAIIGYVGVDFAWRGLPVNRFANLKSWPSGLKWSAAAETLTGIPKKAGDFSRETIDGEPVSFIVRELPPEVVGTFNGWLQGRDGQRHPVVVNTTSSGKITLKVTVGLQNVTFSAKSWSSWHETDDGVCFTGDLVSGAGDQLAVCAHARREGNWTDWNVDGVFLKRGGDKSPMPDPGAEGLAVRAQRSSFGKTGTVFECPEAHEAILSLVGKETYTSRLRADGVWVLQRASAASGGMSAAVTVKESGAAVLSGKLADGSSVTASATVLYREDGSPVLWFYFRGSWIRVFGELAN